MAEKIEWPPIGMTLDEAAAALRVDSKTIRTLIKAGDFPARKVGVGWRIDPDAVKRWLDIKGPRESVSAPDAGWAKRALTMPKADPTEEADEG